MAPFYAVTVSEFVAALGLKRHDVFDLKWRLSEGQGALIAARYRDASHGDCQVAACDF